MKRIFLSNIILLVLVNLVIKPIWVFGVDRNIQLQVGNEQYGLYSALLSISIVINSILDIGLTNYNNRELAKDFSKANELYSPIIFSKFILSIFYFITLTIIGYSAGYNNQILFTLFLIGLIQFLNSLLSFLRSNISALHHFKFDTFLSVLDKLIIIIIWGSLLIINERELITLQNFIYSQIIAYAVSIIISIIYLQNIKFQFSSKINSKKLIDVIKNALPTALLILLMGIYLRSDNFLIERLLPKNGQIQSGLYSMVFRILDSFNMIGFLFASLLLPIFSRLLAQKQNINELVTMACNMLFPASIATSIFCYFYSSEIIDIVYNIQDAGIIHSFSLIMICFPLISIMNIFSTLLTANSNIKTLIYICTFSSLVTVISNIIFIPQYGYNATIIIAICSNAIAGILFITFSTIKVNFRFNLLELNKYLSFIVSLIALNYFLNISNITFLGLVFINIIITTLLYIIFSWFKIKTLTQYIGNKLR